MPVATLNPPAAPVVVYCTDAGSGNWTCATSTGTVLATASAKPLKDIANALRAASVDLSTLVTVLSPSGNPAWNHGQLNDMPTT
jgi:hypothetical protein